MNLRQAVIFSILMENSNGIIGKSPSYIREKLAIIESMEDEEKLISLLDEKNKKKYIAWKVRWGGERWIQK